MIKRSRGAPAFGGCLPGICGAELFLVAAAGTGSIPFRFLADVAILVYEELSADSLLGFCCETD